MTRWKSARMSRARLAIVAATFLASLAATPAYSQEQQVLRYGNTSGWSFDIRDDDRDSSSNGFFPGNFASHPSVAWSGTAGLLGSNPRRSATPYPSQIVFGSLERRQISALRKRANTHGSLRHRNPD
jgi:hypothetical protein